jgi:hypothetical protein
MIVPAANTSTAALANILRKEVRIDCSPAKLPPATETHLVSMLSLLEGLALFKPYILNAIVSISNRF